MVAGIMACCLVLALLTTIVMGNSQGKALRRA
jgi:hypothetical protein